MGHSNFAFERGHYDVSLAATSRGLPLVVDAESPATWAVVSGCRSRRTKTAQTTGRHAVHVGELLDHAGERTHP